MTSSAWLDTAAARLQAHFNSFALCNAESRFTSSVGCHHGSGWVCSQLVLSAPSVWNWIAGDFQSSIHFKLCCWWIVWLDQAWFRPFSNILDSGRWQVSFRAVPMAHVARQIWFYSVLQFHSTFFWMLISIRFQIIQIRSRHWQSWTVTMTIGKW